MSASCTYFRNNNPVSSMKPKNCDMLILFSKRETLLITMFELRITQNMCKLSHMLVNNRNKEFSVFPRSTRNFFVFENTTLVE